MAKGKEGICVDAETLLAIQDGNKEVIKEFKKDLSLTTTEIKEYMLLHISPLKDDVVRIRNDVADLYDKDRDMRDRVGALEQRQSADEGNRSGRDVAGGIKHSEKELTWAKVGILVAVFSAVTGLIVYFV